MFKDIIRAILTVLLPIIFAAIMARYPDFPIPQNVFTAFIFWVLEKLGIVVAVVVGLHDYFAMQVKYGFPKR